MDSNILEQLYKEYRYLMYHVAYGILQDYGLTEDAVQEAFIKLTKNNYQIDEIICNKTKTFMVIVIRSVALNIYNREKKHGEVYYLEDQLVEAVDHNLSPLELIVSTENIKNIEMTLQTMDPKYAAVMTLKYLYNYPNKKIAEILSISDENVYVRLHRARKILITKLSNGGTSRETTRTQRTDS